MGRFAVLNVDGEGAPDVVAFYLSPAGANVRKLKDRDLTFL
jgi:hypothetical protein